MATESRSHLQQLTWRAAITGAALGALLVPCNVYSGLKIGWSFNMSIAAALLSCGFWGSARSLLGTNRVAHWGLLENNINQTCASSAASIISAGLVAPIPALTILTGQTLSWVPLATWLFSVSTIGVVVGLVLRRQMIVVERLPFPSGVATAETVREIYARGSEATRRVLHLLVAGVMAAGTKLAEFSQWGPAWSLSLVNLPAVSTRSLGWVFDPSCLMIGFGAIVGLRVGVSLLLGAAVAWGLVAPWLFSTGRLPTPEDPSQFVYLTAVEYLLWPGVALMVCSALVSFGCSLFGQFLGRPSPAGDADTATPSEREVVTGGFDHSHDRVPIPRAWLLGAFGCVAVLAVTTQVLLFQIALPMAVLAVLLTFVLAVVAARVSGETGIPPIGALGKVTQLTFGFIHPTSVSVNLMTANVTGGAAGQCSDLLHDLKAGQLLGASVHAQALAQLLGVIVGSLAGSAAYLVLVPDPATMLLTPEWPAPAVATWKAVAELFRDGIEAAPPGAMVASACGGTVGIALAVLNHWLPEGRRQWSPSAVSLGLAFVIPAWNSLSLFLGAALAALVARIAPAWAKRFVLPIAAGLVAGESLAGVGSSLWALIAAG